jgi:uncharacterized protein
MAMFGADFHLAKHSWLYPREKLQRLLPAVLFFVLLVILDGGLQLGGGALAYKIIFGGPVSEFASGISLQTTDPIKASIIGMMPAAVVLVLIAVFFGRLGLPEWKGRLLLHRPDLGVLGWLLIVVGFAVLMAVIFNGIFVVLGIDPETYSPAGGLSDHASSSGLVEKTMAELAKDPLLFAAALPGVILAAPITEELIFRGALFSAIASSRLGRIAAVLITSALWALVHVTAAPWLFVGVLFLMGICLGVLLLRFGSLWVTIVCHAAWNGLSSLAIFGLGTHS